MRGLPCYWRNQLDEDMQQQLAALCPQVGRGRDAKSASAAVSSPVSSGRSRQGR
jgi:hypothetical protein